MPFVEIVGFLDQILGVSSPSVVSLGEETFRANNSSAQLFVWTKWVTVSCLGPDITTAKAMDLNRGSGRCRDPWLPTNSPNLSVDLGLRKLAPGKKGRGPLRFMTMKEAGFQGDTKITVRTR